MTTLSTIVVAGLLMSVIALSGSLTLVFSKKIQERITLPLVALAAGTLLGGAFFHMIPTGMREVPELAGYSWVLAGFAMFLALEQLVHLASLPACFGGLPAAVTYLILIGDGVHNFLGGLAIAGAFITDITLGWSAWIAAAAHEIPQELGDFGVLIHGGWDRRRALLHYACFIIGVSLMWFLASWAPHH